MQKKIALLILGLAFFQAHCGTAPLAEADQEVAGIVTRLSEGEGTEDEALADDILRLNEILLDVYEGAYDPIPEEEIEPVSPFTEEDVEPIEIFRYGGELPSHPEDESSAGAFVGRPTSASYAKSFVWAVSGDWTEIFSRTYSKFERTYNEAELEDFLNGDRHEILIDNDVINLADRGVVFAYLSQSRFRRVRNEEFPGGEVLLHWERLQSEAERIEGGNNAYLNYLLNFQIYMRLDDERSWRVANTWTTAGGSVLFFSGTANSGDIGKGIRKDFEDLKAYIDSQE